MTRQPLKSGVLYLEFTRLARIAYASTPQLRWLGEYSHENLRTGFRYVQRSDPTRSTLRWSHDQTHEHMTRGGCTKEGFPLIIAAAGPT